MHALCYEQVIYERDAKTIKVLLIHCGLGMLAVHFNCKVQRKPFLGLETKSLFCQMNRDKKKIVFLVKE